MQFGMIGLGRMGANMVRRLMKNGHKCVVYDRSADAVGALAKEGATGASSRPARSSSTSCERRSRSAIPSTSAVRALAMRCRKRLPRTPAPSFSADQ